MSNADTDADADADRYREWITGAEDTIDAIARSIADGTERWEWYHAGDRHLVRFEAEYFLTRLRARGFDVVEKIRP